MNTRKLTAGWTFRSSTPSFDVGEEFAVYVTGADAEGRALARVGDTVLTVHDAPSASEGTKIRVRVTDFDESAHAGDAEFLETVGRSTY